jgi:hypothetical protein
MRNIILFVATIFLLVSSSYQKVTRKQLAVVGPLTKSAFQCLAQQGYSWSVVRVYQISSSPAPGAVDKNAAKTL